MDDIACALAIIAVLICVAVIYHSPEPGTPGVTEGFLPSTFQLGSYDPSRYVSEITRRP